MSICPKCFGRGKVPDHRKIGRAARHRRMRAGLTLQQAGDALGVSDTFLCLLEHGKRSWTMELYKKAMRI